MNPSETAVPACARNPLSVMAVMLALAGGTASADPAAAQAVYPVTRADALTYVVDYEPFWSPDGRQIVFISSRDGGMRVHVMDADGGHMRALTQSEGEDDSPAWSPDGKQIAYVSMHNGASQLFVMDADGSNVRQLTHGAGDNIHPAWSPDSARILFDTAKIVVRGPRPVTAATCRDAAPEPRPSAAVNQ